MREIPEEPDGDAVAAGWLAAMQRGDFEAAWRETDRIELRRRALAAGGTFEPQPQHLVWDGTPFDGHDVRVRCNHGLGDSLQFMRYVPRVVERARSVTVLIQPPLVELFAGVAAFGDVRNGWTDQPPPAHDVDIEVMELPYAFRSTVETLPRDVPYLPSASVERAAAELPPLSPAALNVGLLWASSDWDVSRSLPLSALRRFAGIDGVAFYSLQQGEQREAYARAPIAMEPLHRHTETIAAAAAAMSRLDLVITVDSMAAHLAGALGRPVWVLLQHEADWRWMLDRADSPWYPTMRLFRQRSPGAWDALAQRVARALEAWTRGA